MSLMTDNGPVAPAITPDLFENIDRYRRQLADGARMVQEGTRLTEEAMNVLFGNQAPSLQPEQAPTRGSKYHSIEEWRDAARELGTFTVRDLAKKIYGVEKLAPQQKAATRRAITRLMERERPMVAVKGTALDGKSICFEFVKPAADSPKAPKTSSSDDEEGAGRLPVPGTGRGQKITTNKDIDRLLGQARSAGWLVIKNGDGHIQVRPPGKKKPVSVAATPSDPRAVANLRAALKREGLSI